MNRIFRGTALFIVLLLLALFAGCGFIVSEPSPPDTPEALPTVVSTTPPVTLPPTEPPATEPPATEATEPEQIREESFATLLVTGDIMSHLPVVNAGYTGSGYQYDRFFRYIAPYASEADFAVANLETTFAGTENGDKYSGFPRFNCPDAMAEAVKNAGFDMLLTANNHTYDTGVYGFNRTLEVIAEKDLLSLGTTNAPEEKPYRIIDLNGIRVGMICYTYGQIDPGTGQKSVNGLPMNRSLTDRINVFDYDRKELFYTEMEQRLRDLEANGAEFTVLFIHWGNEYRTYQNTHQEQIAQKLCNLGVDVIVGGHPHVLQPAELLTSRIDSAHHTLCTYSVGNFLSNQHAGNMDLDSGHTEDGMLFRFRIVKYSNGEVFLDSADFIPTWVCIRQVDGSRSYDILPLDAEVDDWKHAFSLDSATLRKAEGSFDRSYEILGSCMEEISNELDEIRSQRERSFRIFRGGVG